MLLVHQTGSVHIGELVRYTITYTPSKDRVLPTPATLHLRIKNSTASPFRAAYLVGPYNLYVAAYPAAYDPSKPLESPRKTGAPDFEPNLRAGATWNTQLVLPPEARLDPDGKPLRAAQPKNGTEPSAEPKQVTWVVDIISQVLFSRAAEVDFELSLGRDSKSLDLVSTSVPRFLSMSSKYAEAGELKDHLPKRPGPFHEFYTYSQHEHYPITPTKRPKGVFSDSINLMVEDTAELWNLPYLPGEAPLAESHKTIPSPTKKNKQKKIHLVILTHGLTSNIGADMFYMKERIDAATQEAKGARRAERERKKAAGVPVEDEEEDEEVVVRGFPGNVSRTENGIQYLGKRVAKYVLELTYPSQPFLPTKRESRHKLHKAPPLHYSSMAYHGRRDPSSIAAASGEHWKEDQKKKAYKFTSISFVAHSLGGPVQIYALAYIQKHSPDFFNLIKPVNFVTLASPLLGLTNENPIYVRFALDFGLVGRSGQDLGRNWRPPAVKRSWSSVLGVPDEDDKRYGMKPLLRILPTGLAHDALKRFKTRTLYSNVVNDGIVPLRTSCLLFLDWKGLGKVQKAQREAGLITTVAGWGWSELMGQQSTSPKVASQHDLADEDESRVFEQEDLVEGSDPGSGQSSEVPQPTADAVAEEPNVKSGSLDSKQSDGQPSTSKPREAADRSASGAEPSIKSNKTASFQSNSGAGAFDGFFNLFKFSNKPADQNPNGSQSVNLSRKATASLTASGSKKDRKIIHRSQTLNSEDPGGADLFSGEQAGEAAPKPSGHKRLLEKIEDMVSTPPKTSIFESAGDILNPPLPPQAWFIDPEKRDKVIFHDRIYRPEDIPPPPPGKKDKKKEEPTESSKGESSKGEPSKSESVSEAPPSTKSSETEKPVGMRVEEKIARSYHKDLSWRKVLVRLEPEAHNNIIVRRMFANAYGWPVVQHLCDMHFGPQAESLTALVVGKHHRKVSVTQSAPSSPTMKPNSGTDTSPDPNHGDVAKFGLGVEDDIGLRPSASTPSLAALSPITSAADAPASLRSPTVASPGRSQSHTTSSRRLHTDANGPMSPPIADFVAQPPPEHDFDPCDDDELSRPSTGTAASSPQPAAAEPDGTSSGRERMFQSAEDYYLRDSSDEDDRRAENTAGKAATAAGALNFFSFVSTTSSSSAAAVAPRRPSMEREPSSRLLDTVWHEQAGRYLGWPRPDGGSGLATAAAGADAELGPVSTALLEEAVRDNHAFWASTAAAAARGQHRRSVSSSVAGSRPLPHMHAQVHVHEHTHVQTAEAGARQIRLIAPSAAGISLGPAHAAPPLGSDVGVIVTMGRGRQQQYHHRRRWSEAVAPVPPPTPVGGAVADVDSAADVGGHQRSAMTAAVLIGEPGEPVVPVVSADRRSFSTPVPGVGVKGESETAGEADGQR